MIATLLMLKLLKHANCYGVLTTLTGYVLWPCYLGLTYSKVLLTNDRCTCSGLLTMLTIRSCWPMTVLIVQVCWPCWLFGAGGASRSSAYGQRKLATFLIQSSTVTLFIIQSFYIHFSSSKGLEECSAAMQNIPALINHNGIGFFSVCDGLLFSLW